MTIIDFISKLQDAEKDQIVIQLMGESHLEEYPLEEFTFRDLEETKIVSAN